MNIVTINNFVTAHLVHVRVDSYLHGLYVYQIFRYLHCLANFEVHIIEKTCKEFNSNQDKWRCNFAYCGRLGVYQKLIKCSIDVCIAVCRVFVLCWEPPAKDGLRGGHAKQRTCTLVYAFELVAETVCLVYNNHLRTVSTVIVTNQQNYFEYYTFLLA